MEQEAPSAVPHGHSMGHCQYHKCSNLMLSATSLTTKALLCFLTKYIILSKLKNSKFLKSRRLATACAGVWNGVQTLKMISNMDS